MTLHKQCVEEITETCCGKQKRRVSKLIPVMQSNRRISSNTGPNQSGMERVREMDRRGRGREGGREFRDNIAFQA